MAQVWASAVGLHASRPFLLNDEDGGCLSYADADLLVQAMARGLASAGLTPGDRVGLCTGYRLEGILLILALARQGLVMVVVDPELPAQERRNLMAGTSPRFLLGDAQGLEPLAGLAPGIRLESPQDGPASAFPGLGAWLADGPLETAPWTDPEAPAALLFTSGSASGPKGVLLSQGSLVRTSEAMVGHFGWDAQAIHLVAGEFHTIGGLRTPALAVALAGACSLLAAPRVQRSGPALLECLRRNRVTHLSGGPATLLNLVQAAERSGLLAPSLRQVMSSGSPLSAPVRAAFERVFGVPVVDFYGLTETGGTCLAQPVSGRGGMVPVGAQVRIGAPGEPRLPGVPGELHVHSSNVLLGVCQPGQASWTAREPGWLATGDLALEAEGGGFQLVGRLKDVFKNRHGEALSCSRVEAALLAQPGVVDAAVAVLPGLEGLESLVALVVLDPAQTSLATVKTGLLARLGPKRMPDRMLLAPGLPRSAHGKLPRQALLALAQALI